MVTLQNHAATFASLPASAKSAGLQDRHDFIRDCGNDIGAFYQADPEIRQLVDEYLAKLSEQTSLSQDEQDMTRAMNNRGAGEPSKQGVKKSTPKFKVGDFVKWSWGSADKLAYPVARSYFDDNTWWYVLGAYKYKNEAIREADLEKAPKVRGWVDVGNPDFSPKAKKEKSPKKATGKKAGGDFADRMKAAREAKTVKPPAAHKQEKKEKVEKPAKAEKPVATLNPANFTADPGPEITLLKSVLGLHQQKRPRNAVILLWNRLNKFLAGRKTDGNSKWDSLGLHYADEFKSSYTLLKDCVATRKQSFEVELPAKLLSSLTTLAASHKVWPSLQLIRSFIGWSEQEKSPKQIAAFLVKLKNAAKKLSKADPYADQVRGIIAQLETDKSARKFDAFAYDLAGLQGIAGGAQRVTVATSAKPKGRVSAGALTRMDYKVVEGLPLRFRHDLGRPATNAIVMIWGEPGNGKSHYSLELASALGYCLGKGLYVTSEEFGSASLVKKLKQIGVGDSVGFSEKLTDVQPTDRFAVIDSVNHYGLTVEEFRAFRKCHLDLFIVLIMQATKGGQFKGSKEWEHDVDTVLEVRNRKAIVTKNRYAE